ncbi:MAG: DUF2298 domain-containing protein [Acidobacteriota bacterium]
MAVLTALAWYAVIACGGAAAFGVLRGWGLGAGVAVAVSRVVAWTFASYLAWLAAWIGLPQWWWAGLVPLAVMAWFGRREWRGTPWRTLGDPELVGAAAFVLLALLRLPAIDVRGTEKPMDLAILATLLRPGTMPPSDPWLAGEALPYYYWGFVPWTLPAKILGLVPDVAFNLLVPTLAALCAQSAWALARAVGGSRRVGVMAAFLVVFAGTPEGWRQWLAGEPFGSSDLWRASRQITGTITEFPLFTFQLGDLHPHVLCVPFFLVALFLARGLVGSADGPNVPFPAVALIFGAAAATSPWCALPLGLGILICAAATEHGFSWPVGEGRARWLRVVAIGALGWVAYAPFWLAYDPPYSGMGLVHAPTRWQELFLLLGAALLAAVLTAWEVSQRLGGFEAARRQLARALWMAGMVLVALISGSVGLALAVATGAVLAVAVIGGQHRRVRPAWGLTLVALALLALMETVYLKDPYGAELFRMNTVFKASHLIFVVLGVLTPVLLGWLRRRRPVVAAVAAALVLAAGVPQLLALAVAATGAARLTWNGLDWMPEGERRAASWLRTAAPAGSALVEAVGDAYSDAARISAASGVPAALGWENHELVWRGDGVRDEMARRKNLVDRLYGSGDPTEVRSLASTLGARYVVIGGMERDRYDAGRLDGVLRAGALAFESPDCVVVDLGGAGRAR